MNGRDPTLRDVVAPLVRELVAEATAGPLLVSQKNVEATFGLTPRILLELLRRADCPCTVIRVGKLRLVDAHELRRWLVALECDRRARPEVHADGADAVLAELGLRVVRHGQAA